MFRVSFFVRSLRKTQNCTILFQQLGSFYLENIFVVVAIHHLEAMYTALSINPLKKHFFKKKNRKRKQSWK
jgi:hypothetical protein